MTRQLDNSLYRYSQRSAGTINYDINGLNQIDYILSGDNFTYDTDGNLTDIGTTDDYAYDDRHRLTETPAGTDLTYGADGNLDTLTTARQFTYDGTNITIERNASDAIAYRYVHAGGLGAPALRLSGTGNTTQEFYLTDERGSVIAATNTSGARAYINTYDEYGVEGTGNSGLYGYTGQVRLGDNSLTHNRNRAYGAALGRFLQTDPIGQAGGINLYAYVGGDPINFVDPWGLRRTRRCDEVPDQSHCREPGTVTTGNRVVCFICGYFGGQGIFGSGWLGSRERPNDPNEDVPGDGEGSPHRYEINVVTECSASTTFSIIRAPGNSAPGAPRAEAGTHYLVLTGGNPVEQTVDVSNRTITNVTLPGHTFHPGDVNISVQDLGGRYSNINITGTGTGRMPLVNSLVGTAYFGGMAFSVAEYCRVRNGGTP
ncbi:RHS repeat-associated core domain-containing protein [Hyphobacterium sp.]|uniref:RHS repeat-associated core domain-containing protein n=1 Tax=Hyphobacterium sp. TaxID=2004662 RepID=UPI003BA9666D